MVARVATIVVEPRDIVREALASLLERLQYRVSGRVASPAGITDASMAGEGCKLAILVAASVEKGVSDAVQVRSVWPDCKILLILEDASGGDLQTLVDAEIDGCIPFEVSADTLGKALELIVDRKLRVMITGSLRTRLTEGVPRHPRPNLFNNDEAASIAFAGIPAIAAKEGDTSVMEASNGHRSMSEISPLLRKELSGRELQILDSLVKGHANKVIARTCAISEATVKVHMKSILRKIRVANRTQAAVWALEHGYCDDGPEIES